MSKEKEKKVVPMEQALAQVMHHMSTNNIPSAEKIISAQMEEHPLEPSVLHAAGLVAFRKNNIKEAIEQLEKAVQIDKRNQLISDKKEEIKDLKKFIR